MQLIEEIKKKLYQKINEKNIYSFDKKRKKYFFENYFYLLNQYHYKNCKEYKKIIISEDINLKKKNKLESLPFLPVELFKDRDLYSFKFNKKSNIVLKSSGTSGTNSKIYLDYLTSFLQSKALIKILKNYFGDKGYSILLLSGIPRQKKLISASTAGSLGFSLNASNIYHVFKDGKIDIKNIKNFLKKKNKKIFFGFTFEVWNFFRLNKKYLKENKINFFNCNLLHGGGWKKITSNKVSETMFDNYFKNNFKFSNIINYYGLVEQTGSIFMQCEKNRHFHTSDFSEIIIRDNNFNSIINKKGVVQLFSLLPLSYPGHNIVTRDIGKIIGEDDCSCGRKGKYFKIYGRLKDSEVRGCSDTIK